AGCCVCLPPSPHAMLWKARMGVGPPTASVGPPRTLVQLSIHPSSSECLPHTPCPP
ncbi:unnamed protein product, partial [Amoebophrya sp. A120]